MSEQVCWLIGVIVLMVCSAWVVSWCRYFDYKDSINHDDLEEQ